MIHTAVVLAPVLVEAGGALGADGVLMNSIVGAIVLNFKGPNSLVF